MRHVRLTDLQANAAQLTAAIDAGEEVVITLGERDYQLVARQSAPAPDDEATIARRRAALNELQKLREELRAAGVRITQDEAKEWVNEGRR